MKFVILSLYINFYITISSHNLVWTSTCRLCVILMIQFPSTRILIILTLTHYICFVALNSLVTSVVTGRKILTFVVTIRKQGCVTFDRRSIRVIYNWIWKFKEIASSTWYLYFAQEVVWIFHDTSSYPVNLTYFLLSGHVHFYFWLTIIIDYNRLTGKLTGAIYRNLRRVANEIVL